MKNHICKNCPKVLPDPSQIYCSHRCHYDDIAQSTVKAHNDLARDLDTIWPLLTKKEQTVARYRQRGWTLERIGKKLGLTKQGVSYIEVQLKKRVQRFRRGPQPPKRKSQRV